MRFFSTKTFHQAGVIFAFLYGSSSFFESTNVGELCTCLIAENGGMSLQTDRQSTSSFVAFGELSPEVPSWLFPISEREANDLDPSGSAATSWTSEGGDLH